MPIVVSFVASILFMCCVVIGATSVLYWINDRTLNHFVKTHRRQLIQFLSFIYLAVMYIVQALAYDADPTSTVFGYHWIFLNMMLITLFVMMMEVGSKLEIVVWSGATGLYIWHYANPLTWQLIVAYLFWGAMLILLTLYGPKIKASRVLYYSGIAAFGLIGITVIYTMRNRTTDIYFWMRQISSYAILSLVTGEYSRLTIKADNRTAALRNQATLDHLTGLANLSVFNDDMLSLSTAYATNQAPFTMFECDLDHFKAINDKYGHPDGNRVLMAVADALNETVTTFPFKAKLYRIGGEEFSLLVDGAIDAQTTLIIAAKIHQAVATITLPEVDAHLKLTLSLGAAAATPMVHRASDIYSHVDENLYMAKRNGRDAFAFNSRIWPSRDLLPLSQSTLI